MQGISDFGVIQDNHPISPLTTLQELIQSIMRKVERAVYVGHPTWLPVPMGPTIEPTCGEKGSRRRHAKFGWAERKLGCLTYGSCYLSRYNNEGNCRFAGNSWYYEQIG